LLPQVPTVTLVPVFPGKRPAVARRRSRPSKSLPAGCDMRANRRRNLKRAFEPDHISPHSVSFNAPCSSSLVAVRLHLRRHRRRGGRIAVWLVARSVRRFPLPSTAATSIEQLTVPCIRGSESAATRVAVTFFGHPRPKPLRVRAAPEVLTSSSGAVYLVHLPTKRAASFRQRLYEVGTNLLRATNADPEPYLQDVSSSQRTI
jgi:hypothetical protein